MWRAEIFFGGAGAAAGPVDAAELTPLGDASVPGGEEDTEEAEETGAGAGAAGGAEPLGAGAAAVVVATLAPSAAARGGGSAPPQAADMNAARTRPRTEATEANGEANDVTRMGPYFLISTSSTSKLSVELGGMALPIPRSP